MVKNIMLIFVALLTCLITVNAADYYKKVDFSYDFADDGDDVQVLVFKCEDSTCSSGNVEQIETQIYDKSSKSACFGDLSHSAMNSCMNNYEISGNKAPLEGMVVKFTGVEANVEQNYLLSLSVEDDTYVTMSGTVGFTTSFTDYDYAGNDFDLTFTKDINPISKISEFEVLNTENDSLPVQVSIQADMDASICSGFNYKNDYHKPQFDDGYSDYSLKTDITLEYIDVESGIKLGTDSEQLNIEADTCEASSVFSWEPPNAYEGREIEFKVTADIVDSQAHEPLQDQQSLSLVVYPLDLTDACYVIADNLTISSVDEPTRARDLIIIEDGNAFVSFDIESYKSFDDEGDDKIFNPYKVAITLNETEIVDETVRSDDGRYVVDITDDIEGLDIDTYNIEATITPVDNSCSYLEPVVLQDVLSIESEEELRVVGSVPVLEIADTSLFGDRDTVNLTTTYTATDEEDGDLTNQVTCVGTSNGQYVEVTADNGDLTIERVSVLNFTSEVTCNVVDADENSISETLTVTYDEYDGVLGTLHRVDLELNPNPVAVNETFTIDFEVIDAEEYVDCVITVEGEIIGIVDSGQCVGDFSLPYSFSEVGEYTIELSTQDSNGNIIEVSEEIEVNKGTYASTSGREVDFRGHLQTLLKENVFKPGENYFATTVVNNHNKAKEITYTITGQNIRVEERGSYKLDPFETRKVGMSILLPQSVQPGLYVVRVTMSYDNERNSKVTYLKVGEETMIPTYTIKSNEVGYNLG